MNWNPAVVLMAAVALNALAAPAEVAPAGTIVNFSSLDTQRSLSVHGTLYLPANCTAPCPTVVVVHGTSGIDSRGAFYRGPLLQAGIAMLEVDFKTGIYTTPLNRPKPATFVPLGFAALKALRKLPAIDPDRIAIMGFSLGGHLALETALEANRKAWLGSEKGFAAHVGFYPVCKTFLKQDDCRVTGAPMLILYGTEDSYGDGANVPAFKQLLAQKYQFDVATVEYAGAHHGFNRNEPAMHYLDPAATHMRGYVAWDEKAAHDSIVRVLDFFQRTFATAKSIPAP